jgi:hypothetical protein
MGGQHTENLFRRYKGKVVVVKSLSGGEYKGHVGEISNDYVLLTSREMETETQTFVLYDAIESIVVVETTS